MSGYQKPVTIKQIEGWEKGKGEGSLADRLNMLDGKLLYYEFIQKDKATLWQVIHSLGFKFPSVNIVDTDGNTIISDIHYKTNNYLELEFSTPTDGIAYIRQ